MRYARLKKPCMFGSDRPCGGWTATYEAPAGSLLLVYQDGSERVSLEQQPEMFRNYWFLRINGYLADMSPLEALATLVLDP